MLSNGGHVTPLQIGLITTSTAALMWIVRRHLALGRRRADTTAYWSGYADAIADTQLDPVPTSAPRISTEI